ncbi:MAG TPA: Hsp20/alpha crystallin family protein [Rhizobiaceae bacterium]|jgi:HSP20 family protein|nr:Hsp20/alpha crystallin family protein [Rhizobiaceae bacterium]
MSMRDLMVWNRGNRVPVQRGEEGAPFLALHREMNRLFDDVFRGFGISPFRFDGVFDRDWSWPHIEVSENDKEVKVTAELPGLDEKDVEVQLSNGVLAIRGEKKTETEDRSRLFSERFYGRFERRIPVDDIDEDKVSASFRNGELVITLPRSAEAQRHVKRIAINGR